MAMLSSLLKALKLTSGLPTTSVLAGRPSFAFMSSVEKPKRPPNSFLLYYLEERQRDSHLAKETLKVKNAAEKWRLLGPEEKQPYIDRSKSAFEIYNNAVNAFRASTSDFELDEIKKKKTNRLAALKKLREKRVKRAMGMPKQPATAYNYFYQSMAKSMKIQSRSQMYASIRSEWAKMTDASKKKFQDQADLDRERYRAEMRVYITKLKKENMEHLIPVTYRKKHLT